MHMRTHAPRRQVGQPIGGGGQRTTVCYKEGGGVGYAHTYTCASSPSGTACRR